MVPGGFEPKTVEVDENSTVTFLNQDKIARWPASNLHPTHDLYPGFDPKKGLNPGESWSFKPKVGSWKYHDHENPHIRGVLNVVPEAETSKKLLSTNTGGVESALFKNFFNSLWKRVRLFVTSPSGEVLDDSQYVRSQMKVCLDSGGKDDCYKKVSQDFSEKYGLVKTLGIFAANENYPEIYSRCHEATHYLSRNEFQKTKSVAQVYAQCDSTCHGGCYHGALEAYLKEKREAFEDIGKAFGEICGRPEDYDKLLVINECHHGLGHAAMFVYDMEVPESLALCDSLKARADQERCYSGVFMENSSSSTNNDHPGRWVKKEDPLFPCNSLGQKYAKICYRYQSSYFALIANHDWEKTADLCLRVPKEYQDDCVRTIGTNQVGFTQNTEVMRKNCLLMPTDHFQETCLTGVISSFAYRFVGDISRMESFCLSLENKFQEACVRQVGASVIDWSKDKKEAQGWCEKFVDSGLSYLCKSAVI